MEGKHGYIGCFYLSENLSEHTDYIFQAQMVEHGLPKALPVALDQHFGKCMSMCLEHFDSGGKIFFQDVRYLNIWPI